MENPILQMLNKKPNQNNLIQKIAGIKQMMSGKDPQILFNSLMQNNSQFRDFVNKSQGKSLEDLAMEYDIDIDLLKKFL